MSGRRGWLVVLVLALVAVAVATVVLRRPGTEESRDAWDADLRVSVRVIHGDRTIDAELTDYPVTRGQVAYEGPRLTESEENWKAAHDYRGVALGEIVDRTVGLDDVGTVTLVALDGWHKTVSRAVLGGTTPAGTVILAISVDGEPAEEWDDAPMLVFLPEDGRFSNDDMLSAFGPDLSHDFGDTPSTTGMMVKGVVFLVIDYDGGPLPTLTDL
jgi:hypothetical protein